MQTSETDRLREAWKRQGDPPCDHPKTEREYYLGSHTGDDICTTCGRVVDKR